MSLDDVTAAMFDMLEEQGVMHKKPAKQPSEPLPPEPLRAPLRNAEPYPVDMLGPTLGGAAKALHESLKAPLALCCQSVLAAASFAVQSHYDVVLPWGERKPLSLFLLSVAESGERKTTLDDLVLGAAKAQEKVDMAGYKIELDQYEADLAKWKAANEVASRKAAKAKTQGGHDDAQNDIHEAGPKPKPPIKPVRFVTDPTVEGLFMLLVTSRPSVAMFSDEAGLLIGGHAMNADNALKTISRWCKLWDGSPFDRVRAGDGAGVLYGRRLALHQQAQPEVMTKLLSDPLANGQGFLARCLVAWPESTIGKREIQDFAWAGNRFELKRLFAVLKGFEEALPRTSQLDPQELDPIELPLSPDAVSMAVDANNQFEALMDVGADLCEMRDRGAKALENACRMAGVMAAIEGGMATREISPTHLERGLVLIQWYLGEALRIRGAAVVPQSVADAETLSKWLHSRAIKHFNTGIILNRGPNQLRDKPRCEAAIGELLHAGYVTGNDPGFVIDGKKSRKSWTVQHVV